MRHPNYHQDHNGLTAFTDIIPLKGTKKITKHLTVIAPLFFRHPPPPHPFLWIHFSSPALAEVL